MSQNFGESYDLGSTDQGSYDQYKKDKTQHDESFGSRSNYTHGNIEEKAETTDQRYNQILDLLGRLEERLRRSESNREETEKEVEDLRQSLDSLEYKYLQTDKSFYEIENRVARIDDLEHKLKKINAADQDEFNTKIEEIREMLRTVDDKTDDSERAYLKVEQKINTLQRTEEDWRASEEDLKKRQVNLEKSVHERQQEMESNLKSQQSDFQDILHQRQIEAEKRLNDRQSEISEAQTTQDKRMQALEVSNDKLVNRMETTQTEQFKIIEKLDDVLAQQSRINRRLDKTDQDKMRLQRKMEYLSEIVDRNNQALQAKAMVLLTDQGIARESNRPYVQPALRANEIVKRDTEEDSREDQAQKTPEYDDNFDENLKGRIQALLNENLDDDDDDDDKDTEETPHETRIKERQTLTGTDKDKHSEAQTGSPYKNDAPATSNGPFSEQLTDFGQSDAHTHPSNRDRDTENQSDEQADTQTSKMSSDTTPDNASGTEKEIGANSEDSDHPRLHPEDLEDLKMEDLSNPFWKKAARSKTGIAAGILIIGLAAGWGVSSLTNLGASSDLADLEKAISQTAATTADNASQDSETATIAAGNTAPSGQGLKPQREYLPGKKFDFGERNTDVARSDNSGAAAGPEAGKSESNSDQNTGNTLRPSEQVLEPGKSRDNTAESLSEEETELARLPADLPERLNNIEPSAGTQSVAGVVPPPKPATSQPAEKVQSAKAVESPEGTPVTTGETNRVGAILSKPFFDPLNDQQMVQELNDTRAQIETFIQNQPNGNLEERIRPDATLSPIVQKIEEKAFQGIPEAQHDLAAIYTAGHAGTEQNFERAAFWFREAAVDNVSNARYNLGVLYHQGLGVKANLEEAIMWYRAASLLGHPEAQYNLGIAHIEGIGTNYRPKLATYYFTKAALQGVPEASYNLGLIYENGLVGSEYPELALYWYQEAANKGNVEASSAHDQLQSQLKLNEKDAEKIYQNIKSRFDQGKDDRNDQRASNQNNAIARPQLASFNTSSDLTQNDGILSDIQRELIALGYYPGPADGAFGPKTEDAIRSFQRDNDLKVTGLPSRELLSEMRAY